MLPETNTNNKFLSNPFPYTRYIYKYGTTKKALHCMCLMYTNLYFYWAYIPCHFFSTSTYHIKLKLKYIQKRRIFASKTKTRRRKSQCFCCCVLYNLIYKGDPEWRRQRELRDSFKIFGAYFLVCHSIFRIVVVVAAVFSLI